MLTLIIRSIIIYTLVLVVFRLMGKRQLGQMQPFELVLTLILADIATIPMTEMSVPILHGIVPLLTLLVIHYVITILCMFFPRFSELVSGKPIIVIDQNGLNYSAIKKLNLAIDDILEALRGAGYFYLQDVMFAIMETNGKISVLPKSLATPVTRQDLKIEQSEPKLPVIIVSEGKIVESSFDTLGIKKQKVLDYIQKLNIEVKKLLVFTLDKDGNVFFQVKNKKSQTLKTNLKEKV